MSFIRNLVSLCQLVTPSGVLFVIGGKSLIRRSSPSVTLIPSVAVSAAAVLAGNGGGGGPPIGGNGDAPIGGNGGIPIGRIGVL